MAEKCARTCGSNPLELEGEPSLRVADPNVCKCRHDLQKAVSEEELAANDVPVCPESPGRRRTLYAVRASCVTELTSFLAGCTRLEGYVVGMWARRGRGDRRGLFDDTGRGRGRSMRHR